jgi:hypothetical protein
MRNAWIFFLLFPLVSTAQKANYRDSLITVQGQVIDTNFNVGFYNMVVVDKSLGKGIFGDYNGKFSITVKKKDQIGVSVIGYQTVNLHYLDSAFKDTFYVQIYLQPLEYTSSEEVIVKPIKTLEQLQEERANIVRKEVPVVTIENAISSPITALYIAFSKREKTKRKVAEMEYQDKQDDIVREILRLYVHNDILDLSADHFDEFINFLNLNTEFLKTATDYELISYIQYKFEHFRKVKEGF